MAAALAAQERLPQAMAAMVVIPEAAAVEAVRVTA